MLKTGQFRRLCKRVKLSCAITTAISRTSIYRTPIASRGLRRGRRAGLGIQSAARIWASRLPAGGGAGPTAPPPAAAAPRLPVRRTPPPAPAAANRQCENVSRSPRRCHRWTARPRAGRCRGSCRPTRPGSTAWVGHARDDQRQGQIDSRANHSAAAMTCPGPTPRNCRADQLGCPAGSVQPGP